ncbi:MAG: Stp1/IreP family PP2C-type Ser/Thr phosphatase [Nitrospirae bacterium]|nr:Stp1/IreP family PP2C-type Ser/Thr phosphatase [Nitrospirota bacterium]
MNYTISSAGLTDKGRVRQRNEDNWMADPMGGIFIVSDGMGGHAGGDTASRVVVEKLPVLLGKKLKGLQSLGSDEAKDRFNQIFGELNDQVRLLSKSNPGLMGMGATVVLAIVRGDKVAIAHMGDSRAYMLSNGQLRQLTEDHSVVQLLIRSGEITAEEAAAHPARGKITRCVGMAGEAFPEIDVLQVEPDDRLLLCSDGLTGMVADSAITGILTAQGDEDEACRALVKAANMAGGVDNITVLIVDFKKENKEFSNTRTFARSRDHSKNHNHVTDMETEEMEAGHEPLNVKGVESPKAYVINLDVQPSDFCLPITSGGFTIGRGINNSLVIRDDRTVSRSHCRIKVNDNVLAIEDLGSRNGTYLNGRRVKSITPIPVPSWLSMGRSRIGIIPDEPDFQQESLLDEAYTTEGSILIPPSEFFEERTEALLVVDIVGSTTIVKHGETQLVKIVSALGQMLDKSLQKEKQPFLKCTGDGFFATFATADEALKSALRLSSGLARHIKFSVSISVALHWGSVRLTQDGERTGRNAHAVFSLEDLRHREEKVNSLLNVRNKREIILMTESFYNVLDPTLRTKSIPVGQFNLKGLDKEEKIYFWS